MFTHSHLVPWLGVVVACVGCASSPPAVMLRAADFGKGPIPIGRPFVVAFKAGERIPVDLDVSGEVVELAPRPSRVWLTCKRDFFLRVDGTHITTSLDGVHFGHPQKPGSFRFGVGADPGGSLRAEIAIVTPVHAR